MPTKYGLLRARGHIEPFLRWLRDHPDQLKRAAQGIMPSPWSHRNTLTAVSTLLRGRHQGERVIRVYERLLERWPGFDKLFGPASDKELLGMLTTGRGYPLMYNIFWSRIHPECAKPNYWYAREFIQCPTMRRILVAVNGQFRLTRGPRGGVVAMSTYKNLAISAGKPLMRACECGIGPRGRMP